MKNLQFHTGPTSQNVTSYYITSDEAIDIQEAFNLIEDNVEDEIWVNIELIEEQEDAVASEYNEKFCVVFHAEAL